MPVSNYESFINTLWKSSKIFLGSSVWRVLYFINYFLAKQYLLRFTRAKHVFLKGSYARGDFKPLLSDIDFVLIFPDDVNRIDSPLNKIRRFAPLVKDIDCFSERGFSQRIAYGSYKFIALDSWKQLDHLKLEKTERFVYPVKEDYDELLEVYFYLEWIQRNIMGECLSSYRIECVRRACERMIKHSCDNEAEQNQLKERLKNLMKGEDLLEFSFLMARKAAAKNLAVKKLFVPEDFDFDEILSRQYYVENFQILEKDKGWSGETLMAFPRDLFEVFYGMGAIDTSILFEKLSLGDDEVLNALLTVEYYQFIEDGKINSLHENVSDRDLAKRHAKAIALLSKCSLINKEGTFHGKTVYVTASWGDEYLKILGYSHKLMWDRFAGEMTFLNVSIGGKREFFESMQGLVTFCVEERSEREGLWHKESLYNLARKVAYGARNIVFADVDTVINRKDWVTEINKELASVDAVNSNSLWAFSAKGLEEIGAFSDLRHDGSNAALLSEKINQSLSHASLDAQIECIGNPAAKERRNMSQMYALLHKRLLESITRDELGLWVWRDTDSDFKHLFTHFLKDGGFFSKNFARAVLEQSQALLAGKEEETEFVLDMDRKVSALSGPNELTFFSGKDIKNAGVYALTSFNKIETNIQWLLDAFENDVTYCFNFILESSSDLKNELVCALMNCESENHTFTPISLSGDLWAIQAVFYSFRNFQKPIFDFSINAKNPFCFEVKSLVEESCSDQNDFHWEWTGENKGELISPMDVLNINIEGSFYPRWNKVVVKIDGPVSCYQVEVFDETGTALCTPRIQEQGKDYLTIYFRPVIINRNLQIRINTFDAARYYFEAVCFVSVKQDR